jgi:hypothetical protein
MARNGKTALVCAVLLISQGLRWLLAAQHTLLQFFPLPAIPAWPAMARQQQGMLCCWEDRVCCADIKSTAHSAVGLKSVP